MKQPAMRKFAPLSTASVGTAAIVLSIVVSVLALAGYLLGNPFLEGINPRFTPMKIITAVCFLMSAAALLCLRQKTPGRKKMTLVRALGGAVGVVGILTFVTYLVELHTGQPWPVAHAPFFDLFLSPSGRMAVITSALFSIYGCVLVLLASGGLKSAGTGHIILIPVTLTAYLVLIGYLFNIPALYYRMNLSIALNTDIAFFCLCIAAFCARPDTWLMEVFTNKEAGGAMARRLLPSLLLLPLVIGWLRLSGERLGLFGSAVGVALVVVTYSVCFFWIVWLNARVINRTDTFRRTAEESIVFQAHLLANVHDAVIGLDRDLVIIYWNDSAQKMYGWTAEEAIGTKSFDILHTVYVSGSMEEIVEKIRTDGHTTYEATHRTKDGRVLQIDVHSALTKDSDGQITGYISSCRDITERKRAEEELKGAHDDLETKVNERTAELKKSSELLDAERKKMFNVLETLPAMICLLTPDYNVVFANKSFRERFGESGGRHCFEYCFGKTEPCDFCESYEVLKTGQPHHWEVNAPDGSVVDAWDFPFFDTDGSPLILEMDMDVTAQKRMAAELRAASLYSRSLLEASLDPLVTISPEGKITDVNDAAVMVTGVPRNRLVGTDFSQYFTETKKAREGYRQVFERGFVTDYPLTIRHKDGRLTDVLYNASVYTDAKGDVVGVFAAARDITAQKAAEAELEKYRVHLEDLVRQRTGELEKVNKELQGEIALRQRVADDLMISNKDLEQFAYVASHDLQEPLRAIGGFVELLKRQLAGSLDGKTKEYMDYVVEGVVRMQSLINGLLEYSRIKTRGDKLEPVDSGAALASAHFNLRTGIQESGAKIVAGPLPTVCMDPTQLMQLFQNLLGNAIKFRSAASTEIDISAVRDNSGWRFGVRDNGIGIDPQYAQRIFIIFQRLHTRTEYPGTGIGLAVCKKIVERHGGRIWMESKPGNGSTFYFTIPDKGEI